jgi:hypothetical protein
MILHLTIQLTTGLQGSKSSNDMGNINKSHLEQVHKNLEKKTKKVRGVSLYLDNGDDDDDDFSDDDFGGDEKNLTGGGDPNNLIDLELVGLLKFCNDLKIKYKDTDDHAEEIMMKSIEVGKKTKEKILLLDMDETMIASKFEDKDGKLPDKFKPNFVFDFCGAKIHVRIRPYLSDTLEKLSQLYELVVFTAGVKDYATPILDKIDPDGVYFKKRLFRDSCIKCD